MRTLNERLAWLAGIIDGEGHISAAVTASSHVKRDGSRGTQLIFTVGIGNTDWKMIEEIQSISVAIGAKPTLTLEAPKNPKKHKAAWKLKFNGGIQAEAVLAATLPYLINKRDRAEIALAMIRHRRSTASNRLNPYRGRPGITDDTWLMQQLGDLKFLNRRGPDPVETR